MLWVLALSLAGDAGASAAPGICPNLASYENQWLVIVGAAAQEAEARKLAAKGGACIVPNDTFSSLKSGLFVVVAGASADRKGALGQVRRVRGMFKGAYAKAAGARCPATGPPPGPDVLKLVAESDQRMAAAPSPNNRSRETKNWEFSGDLDPKSSSRVIGRFHQGRLVRDEEYFFEGGKLASVEVGRFFDTDDEKDAPEGPTSRRYYFLPGGCYQKSAQGGKEGREELYVCLRPCSKEVASKIPARATQVVSAARATSAGLQKVVEGLQDSWVEDITD